mgnify:FL=1|jgi:hypothetical protein
MAKLKIGNEWWTSPTESETGALIMVTGRQGVEPVIATGKYNDRIEITWKYTPDKNGMPDFKTSSLMEQVTDALNNAFAKDSAAVMTGIYTGDGERNWVFYTLNPKKFQYMLNDALKDFELLPITLYAEKDPEWNEYREMKDLSEVFSDD